MSEPQLSLEGNLSLLRQGEALLEALDDRLFLRRRGEDSAVGGHVRHVVEHYRAFLWGLGRGRVDYDDRARDSRVEGDRLEALTAVRGCLREFQALDPLPDRELEVRMDSGEGDGAPEWSRSSAGRELQFLVSHTVHHFALIRLLLAEDGLRLPGGFGVAPSTLAWRRGSR